MTKVVDISAIIQVIGNIYLNPSLLDMTDKYSFCNEDFTEEFHKTLFGTIYNLHKLGVKEITPITIEDYLAAKPKNLAIYKTNKGSTYIQQISKNAQVAAFDYYYHRMKKMTLLRMYQDIGLDISWLYDVDNIFDVKKKQRQEEWLDNTPIEDIAEVVDKKISEIRLKYAGVSENGFYQSGEGIVELIEDLKQNPEVGSPLYGDLINTVTRGARLSKFYLRSSPSGVGKTRMLVADACNFACDELYSVEEKKWVQNGIQESTLFIATEQQLSEIQTAMLSFLAAVNEEHILTGAYIDDEYERVMYAAKILEKAPLHIKELPDFSLQDIENTIKFAVHDWDIKFVCYDYLHSSMKILSEVTSKAKVSGLREDNVLFMISTRLKDLCNEYGIFIITSTQLNGGWQDAEILDQNLLRGAKSLADRVDCGMIAMNVTERDKEALESLVSKSGIEMPQMKISVYKNRRGRWKDILLWCQADRGICRINPIFATDYNYELVEMENMKIKVSAF